MQSRASWTSSAGFNVWDQGSLGRRAASSQDGARQVIGPQSQAAVAGAQGPIVSVSGGPRGSGLRTWGLRATGSGTPAGREPVTRSGCSQPLDLAQEFGDAVHRDLGGEGGGGGDGHFSDAVRRP